MEAEVDAAKAEAAVVDTVDMVEEAAVTAGTATTHIMPIMTMGPTSTMAEATAMLTRRALEDELDKTAIHSSPIIRVVRPRYLNHRQVPVVTEVDRMGHALGVTALSLLSLLAMLHQHLM